MATFKIGRDFDNPISIDEKSISVSHDHASIIIDGDSWTIIDNNSTNGTWVYENGAFRQCHRKTIKPDTWIRLGEEGHRGHYFKARRVLRPNDYREDFEELILTFHEYEETKRLLDSRRRAVKFLTPVLMCAGLVLSFLPGIKDNGLAVRASFMLPGFISPFIQDALLNNLEKKISLLQNDLICPKCRRPLSKSDIIKREHSICNAH